MNSALIESFISGYLSLGYAIVALFFLRFWRESGDRLFALFAAAFALLIVQRVALSASFALDYEPSWAYVLRLLAFVLIIIAVIDKNRTVLSAPR
ncbi:DUF5985 family protein [Gemmatimonas sp.]|uniref:DUF5985 family protein n=1 Tax=Gemmatimonas sp. TaxID=1962908 RepID=UPI003983D778